MLAFEERGKPKYDGRIRKGKQISWSRVEIQQQTQSTYELNPGRISGKCSYSLERWEKAWECIQPPQQVMVIGLSGVQFDLYSYEWVGSLSNGDDDAEDDAK